MLLSPDQFERPGSRSSTVPGLSVKKASCVSSALGKPSSGSQIPGKTHSASGDLEHSVCQAAGTDDERIGGLMIQPRA